jgi:hypothetical protein
MKTYPLLRLSQGKPWGIKHASVILVTLILSCGSTSVKTDSGAKVSDLYPLVQSTSLDSVCNVFRIEQTGCMFHTSDSRVRGSSCYNRQDSLVGTLPAMCMAFSVTEACTVSVILIDSTFMPVAYRHYLQLPPPESQVLCIGNLFPRRDGWYCYSILLNRAHVLSCPVELYSFLWDRIDDK